MEAAGAKAMDVAAGIIRKGNKVLIAQRKDDCVREPRKWEFPGGKIEPGETPEECLKREILEELGIRIRVGVEFCASSVESGGVLIRLRAFTSEWAGGEARALDCRDFRWVGVRELAGFDWAKADIPIVEMLVARGKKPAGGA
jgi:8-oxo-dGTP diphosphatase